MVTLKRNKRSISRKAGKYWLIHVFIFLLVQIACHGSDRYSDWPTFSFCPLGDWTQNHFFDYISNKIHIFYMGEFNQITNLWVIVLIIHGFISFSSSNLQYKKNASFDK